MFFLHLQLTDHVNQPVQAFDHVGFSDYPALFKQQAVPL